MIRQSKDFGASFLCVSQNYTFTVTYSRTCKCARENCETANANGNRSWKSVA